MAQESAKLTICEQYKWACWYPIGGGQTRGKKEDLDAKGDRRRSSLMIDSGGGTRQPTGGGVVKAVGRSRQ